MPKRFRRLFPLLATIALLSALPAAPALTDAPNLDQNRKLHLSPTGGVFSPLDIAGCILWLKADAITGLSDDDPVTTWPDSSGNGNDATQATAGKKPLYKVGIQNGLPVVRADGTDDFMSLTGMTAPAGGFTLIAVLDPPATGETKYFLDSATPRHIFQALSSSGDKVGWYDGTHHPIAAAQSGFQILSWVLTSGANGEIFRNGSSLGTDPYTALAIGGSVGLFANPTGSASWLAADLGESLLYSTALSSGDRQQVEQYLSDKWGITLAQAPRTDFYVRLTWPQLQAIFPLPSRERVRERVS